ncbi:hypothetical protein BHS04_26250 [Myxococcus xanthus]|nr:hypothetical protein BHS04_26250 [Myxococcus xanthus]
MQEQRGRGRQLTGASELCARPVERPRSPLQLSEFIVPQSSNRILVGVGYEEKVAVKTLEARAGKLERTKGVPFDLSGLVDRGYTDATERKPPGRVLKDADIPKPASVTTPSQTR